MAMGPSRYIPNDVTRARIIVPRYTNAWYIQTVSVITYVFVSFLENEKEKDGEINTAICSYA